MIGSNLQYHLKMLLIHFWGFWWPFRLWKVIVPQGMHQKNVETASKQTNKEKLHHFGYILPFGQWPSGPIVDRLDSIAPYECSAYNSDRIRFWFSNVILSKIFSQNIAHLHMAVLCYFHTMAQPYTTGLQQTHFSDKEKSTRQLFYYFAQLCWIKCFFTLVFVSEISFKKEMTVVQHRYVRTCSNFDYYVFVRWILD